MNESSRYIAGVDIGTSAVRCVVARLDGDNQITIVGASKKENNGMKKGVIASLNGPMEAVDIALSEVERTSGYEIDNAAVTINGSHILSTKTDGIVAVSSPNHEVSEDDIARLEEAAQFGKIPANRRILDFIPYAYKLDDQDDIADPFGMVGSRIEVRANVVSALKPHVDNIEKVAEQLNFHADAITPSVIAAATAVLDDKQKQNGVAVIDLGSSTTSVAVYEDGELQFMRVIPLGGINITNDLAICLKVTPEIAEEIKLKHSSAVLRQDSRDIMIKHGREHYSFNTREIDEIVEARLEEIFDSVRKHLKKHGYDKQLPNGIILVGGGANMKNIAQYSKQALELASQVGVIKAKSPVVESANNIEFAAAIGLVTDGFYHQPQAHKNHQDKKPFWARFFHKNK